jgi:hypothetical protein
MPRQILTAGECEPARKGDEREREREKDGTFFGVARALAPFRWLMYLG